MEDKRTEQFAREEAERERIWQSKYGEKMPEVVEMMNVLLKEGTRESRLKLHDLFLDKSFFEHYKQTDIVAGMYVIMQIYEREVESGKEDGILEQGGTVEELQRYIEELKFILYRIDFDIDTESSNELVRFLKQHKTSMVTLETMMTTVVMRPLQMSLKLEKLFEQNKMYSEQFVMQNFINQRWPGNRRIIKKQAEMYLKANHDEYAKECLTNIPVYPQEVCGEEERILEVQEILWRLRYKDNMAYQDVVKYIRKNGMTEDAWRCFLQNEPTFVDEYYITLSDELLEGGLKGIAWVTLEYGEKILRGNEMLLCFMANLCIEEGNIEKAIECLKRVEKPGDITQNILVACQKRVR